MGKIRNIKFPDNSESVYPKTVSDAVFEEVGGSTKTQRQINASKMNAPIRVDGASTGYNELNLVSGTGIGINIGGGTIEIASTLSNATTSAAGLMSATDKAKLDGLNSEDIPFDNSLDGLLQAEDVQSAIDEVAEKIEDLSIATLGDSVEYWADMLREYGGLKACSLHNYRLNRNTSGVYGVGSLYSTANLITFFFDVNAGETWQVKGLYNNTDVLAYAFYDETTFGMGFYNGMDNSSNKHDMDDNTFQSIIQGLSNHYVSGAQTGDSDNYTGELTIPVGVKSLAVCFGYVAKVPGSTMTVKKKISRNPVDLSKKTCRLIDGWSERCVLMNSSTYYKWYITENNLELNVGDTLPIIINDGLVNTSGFKFGNNNKYQKFTMGSRVVRIDVHEGDKLLLDCYSPLKYSMVYTDDEFKIVAINDERRLDGVYTAPCNGFLYIQDVLHRENYIFDEAHGYLAYKTWDNRKKSAVFQADYYNEFAPSVFENWEIDYTVLATANTYTPQYYTGVSFNNKYLLLMMRIRTESDSVFNQNGIFNILSAGSSYTQISSSVNPKISTSTDKSIWVGNIYATNVIDTTTSIRLAANSLTIGNYLHCVVDRLYAHTFDNADEAFVVMRKIITGAYDVDVNGVVSENVNVVASAVGMASIGLLGYNIVSQGATLPIDDDGVSYGNSLMGQEGIAFNGTASDDNGDKNLVYLPVMDWSNFTGVKHHAFRGCENLVTMPPVVEWNVNLVFGNQSFRRCTSLKKVPDMPANGYQLFQDCASLEKVGNITGITNTNGMFTNCYSLKEIGTLGGIENSTNMTNMFNGCSVLENSPSINAQSCTQMQSMYSNCFKMKIAPTITNSGSVTTMQAMFSGCRLLEKIGSMNTSGVTNFKQFVYNCINLVEIESIDFDSVADIAQMFVGCSKLKKLTIQNLGASSLSSYDFSTLTSWGTTEDSHDTLYDSLYTNSDPQQVITVKLSQASLNALSQVEQDNIRSKGITLTT